MNLEATINDFKSHVERIRMFTGAMTVMGFDAHTIAPKGAVATRAKRDGFFESEVHALATGDKMRGFLEDLAPHAAQLDPITLGMYRVCKRNYEESAKIPAEKVRQFSELTSNAYVAWEAAKKTDDFPSFAPYLKDIIAMRKEMLEYRRVDDTPAYDLLLDDYEEGMTMAIYDEFFAKVRAAIVPLLRGVMASKKKIDKTFTRAHFPIGEQRKLSEFIAKKVGYDLSRGYICETAHPFCSTDNRDDVRITTRYDENDFFYSFYSVLHECGHAIYEQNTGDDIADTILSTGASAGLHESQSRFYENIIGRSKAFWEYITPELKGYLPPHFKDATPIQFYEAANHAGPSFIRTEADELTYSLHVMVRYEIERMIFTEDIDVNDLPAIWNKKYEEYIGVTPPNNTRGILQDVHWSGGMFGYFPTYSIGSAYASQFLAYMQREMDVDGLIKSGNLAPITNWLMDKIHRHGSVYTPRDLVGKIAGEQLNADYYTAYLKEKFEGLYEIK
ncbi:MAG: carboxypeptidase M32 [Defluviitaleaceae bacterium]|nr:carboxypeptidase M32 [Defluviitaleaceae bacterium]